MPEETEIPQIVTPDVHPGLLVEPATLVGDPPAPLVLEDTLAPVESGPCYADEVIYQSDAGNRLVSIVLDAAKLPLERVKDGKHGLPIHYRYRECTRLKFQTQAQRDAALTAD